MNGKAQITVVVPVRNRADIVGRTLDSIASQSHRPLSVVLVDNGSTDETFDVLRTWKEANSAADFQVTLLEETQPGACKARNTGLAAVNTPYVMFFDSDDVMSPQHVERAVKTISQNPDADIVGWDVDCVMLNGSTRRLIFTRGNLLFSHVFHAGISTQRYVCRTSLMRAAGCWDTTVEAWNDYELGVRLLMRNPKVIYAGNDVTVTIYRQTQSITGTGFSSCPAKWEHSLDACEETLKHHGQTKALKWIETRRAILAGHYAAEGAKAESDRLLNALLSRTKSKREQWFYRFVRRYVANSGRGVAILAKIFI